MSTFMSWLLALLSNMVGFLCIPVRQPSITNPPVWLVDQPDHTRQHLDGHRAEDELLTHGGRVNHKVLLYMTLYIKHLYNKWWLPCASLQLL